MVSLDDRADFIEARYPHSAIASIVEMDHPAPIEGRYGPIFEVRSGVRIDLQPIRTLLKTRNGGTYNKRENRPTLWTLTNEKCGPATKAKTEKKTSRREREGGGKKGEIRIKLESEEERRARLREKQVIQGEREREREREKEKRGRRERNREKEKGEK